MIDQIKELFLKYIAIDTQSDSNSTSFPSTEKQKDFSKRLVDELKAMGITNAGMDEYGYVMASIASNTTKNIPSVGFIAHVDTAPDADGACKNPQIITNYQGNDIILEA